MRRARDRGDRDLIHHAVGGNPEALSALYCRYLNDVYRFVYVRTGTRADAEDLTAEVFLKMLQRLESYREEGNFLSWLLGIARYTLLDFWRDRYSTQEVSLEQFLAWLPAASHTAPSPNPQKRALLERLLEVLPDHYRHVLELRFLKGCSVTETAQAMGITENYAKVLQHRALKKAANSRISERDI
jgi:RNA polymerase sigma-70 factor (ECF subfamily)